MIRIIATVPCTRTTAAETAAARTARFATRLMTVDMILNFGPRTGAMMMRASTTPELIGHGWFDQRLSTHHMLSILLLAVPSLQIQELVTVRVYCYMLTDPFATAQIRWSELFFI